MSLFDNGTDYDATILAPNRFSQVLGVPVVRCECGASPAVYHGEISNHFPVMYEGRPATLTDPFFPGTALCRYSGRTVTAEAAMSRDERPTRLEKRVACLV